jgi:hypothetical protein
MTRGGKRKAGRGKRLGRPRIDDPTCKCVTVWLTKDEHAAVRGEQSAYEEQGYTPREALIVALYRLPTEGR